MILMNDVVKRAEEKVVFTIWKRICILLGMLL